MKTALKMIALLLAVLMILPIAACSETTEQTSSDTTAASGGDAETTAAEETEYVDTRFDGVDFTGRAFRVSSSTDTNDATNANALIAGSGELNGDLVNDAVYYRNMSVEELLNIDLQVEEVSYGMGSVANYIKTIVMAGDNAFELFINDIYPICGIIADGLFHNFYGAENFDRTRDYWYNGYMDDLQIFEGYEYVLAGDYFTDVLASAHTLYYNKNLIGDIYGDPDLIYHYVADGVWTMDKMTEIVDAGYLDLNGDSTVNQGDRFGYASIGMWGPMIPFVVGCDVTFIDRSSGSIEFAFNNERSVTILEKLNKLFYSDGTISNITDYTAQGLRNLFANGETLIVGYQRLGDLANMRDIEFDIGVIPYPKLDESQANYVTSTHDTTEIGVIPVTVNDMNFVTTCIEVLNRETAKQVIPEYYETALKIKYTRDELSAQMIDIIHDNFGSSFALGYGVTLSNFMLSSTFSTPLSSGSTDFASAYEKSSKAANKMLEKLISKMLENCVTG